MRTPLSHPLNYRVDYGDWAFDYDLSVPGKLSYTGATEAVRHVDETVDVSVVPVASEVFVVSFTEPSASIVSVQDFGRRVVNTWLTLVADNSLVHMTGELIPA
ncbi:hypothetical protein FKR81_17335 [Lentzea tibetensis]|uniref:MoaF-like domain-containing protein n=1 Tax=Lentzea tibetensis TaxID=2591470 RepID=A0A563EUN3_9PSEU|nr:hypothetical protein [Lentzea tibetensis]TWP50854.1 hypothetical protein FKR81_17335 [Lentzea tibetensis]